MTDFTRQAAAQGIGAGNQGLSAIQTSGIAIMSGLRHVNKIPTIRGTDIIRDPRLNKVMQSFFSISDQSDSRALFSACMTDFTSWKKLI